MGGRWTQVTKSDFPWERDALTYLEAALPDRDPYRAYANFEFILDGAIADVDALVIAPKGVFLIEIKSWPGRLEGDAGTWRQTRPNEVRPRSFDNPLLLTNRKAKRLKSLLGRQKALKGVRIPYIAPLVFLSSADLDCRLDPAGRDGVYGLEADSGQGGGLRDIGDALVRFTQEEHARLAKRKVDTATSEKLAKALEQAGVRPSQSRRKVGELVLGHVLDEGSGYQDFDATHPRFDRTHRRVRIYGAAATAGQSDREQLSRAAEREFQLLEAADHPGTIRALDWHDHELGPALVFERDEGEVRLDHFLAERAERLDVGDRLELLRELAEAVQYAHSRRLYHRALSPRSVLVVRPDGEDQRLTILNWQTGLRESGSTISSTVTGTRDVDHLVDSDTSPYLAPEALSQDGADPELIDVFSLGAIAFHLFAGRAPATSFSALLESLERDGALEVASALDGADENVAELIRQATAADARIRLTSVTDFLELVDVVEEALTAPPSDEAVEEVKVADASQGDRLGDYTVIRRLGRGSTARALQVTDPDGNDRVLKIAVDPDRNDRIQDEGEVLAKLAGDASIIQVHGPPIEVQGCLALVLTHATQGTLASRLQREGRLGLETLERWGADLLGAISYLERAGIAHRDVKPDNLGIVERGRNRHRHLVLMDFSLSRAPASQVRAGTPAYLDPFLGTSDRPRFDLEAERYSAAVVLHEMATGTMPRWGNGKSDPRMISDEATVDRDALPRELAGSLGDLLVRALKRKASERFDTADDMLAAWRRAFEPLDRRPSEPEQPERDSKSLRAAATLDTSLSAIGLSPRAVAALEPLGPLITVEDLLAFPVHRFSNLPSVSLETREELRGLHHELRARLGTPSPFAVAPTHSRPALDAIVVELVPTSTNRNATQVRALRLLLALDPIDSKTGPWPSQTDVANQLEVTRARVGQLLVAERKRWAKNERLADVSEELVAALESLGGFATVEEVERAVTSLRSGDAPLARAAVRAAFEADQGADTPRIAQRRSGTKVLLADARDDSVDAAAALAWVVRLGARADEIAQEEPLAGPAEVLERLGALRPPAGVKAPGPERLVRLAAAASGSAGVSGRLELHPKPLDASRALALGRGVLLGARELGAGDMRERLAARFPEAQPLPDRPELDDLLQQAGIELRWDEENRVYLQPERTMLTGQTSYASSLGRLPTTHATPPAPRADPEVADAAAFESKLEAARRDGGLLTFMVDPAWVTNAVHELERFDLAVVDIDEIFLRHLHQTADDSNVRWDLVVRADAADRTSRDWQRLTALVARAMPAVEADLASREGTILLHNLGLLARYDELGLLDRMRVHLTADSPLRGCWLLVPSDQQVDRPQINGQTISVLTANEYARVPRSWLQNKHRSHPQKMNQDAA